MAKSLSSFSLVVVTGAFQIESAMRRERPIPVIAVCSRGRRVPLLLKEDEHHLFELSLVNFLYALVNGLHHFLEAKFLERREDEASLGASRCFNCVHVGVSGSQSRGSKLVFKTERVATFGSQMI